MRTDFATVLRPAPHAEPDLAERLAGHVVASLIDEVTLAPKPGLVDIRSRGAHVFDATLSLKRRELTPKVVEQADAKSPLDLRRLEAEVAHQLRDDEPSQFVVVVQRVAALDREPSRVDRLVVTRQ